MKIIEKNNSLYAIDEKGNYLFVKNASKQLDGFHLIHGWYIYPKPISLDLEYEIIIENENICRIIKKIENN